MLVVDRLENLPVVGLHVFAHYFHGRLFVAPDDRDRFGIAAQIPDHRVRFLLNHFARRDHADKDERNIQLGDVQDMLEAQLFGLESDRRAHQPGGCIAGF